MWRIGMVLMVGIALQVISCCVGCDGCGDGCCPCETGVSQSKRVVAKSVHPKRDAPVLIADDCSWVEVSYATWSATRIGDSVTADRWQGGNPLLLRLGEATGGDATRELSVLNHRDVGPCRPLDIHARKYGERGQMVTDLQQGQQPQRE